MKFEEILKRIVPQLRAIAYKLQRMSIFFSQEDLYQEAVLYLWEEYKKDTLRDKTDSYILQGCYFYLKNYIRVHCKKIDRNVLHLSSMIDSEGDSRNDTFLSSVIRDESAGESIKEVELESLKEAVQKNLLPREKKILALHLNGLTTRQIGQRLGISHVRVVKLGKVIRNKCKTIRAEVFC